MGKSLDTVIIQILLILAVAILIVVVYPRLKGRPHKPPDEITTAYFVYDTDPQNNDFIRARLEVEQLKQLDRLLMVEKENSGLRLSNVELEKLTGNDQIIIDAYSRWRKCKDMMRSYHHSIYPDERKHYNR
jgi:hypothetical protein